MTEPRAIKEPFSIPEGLSENELVSLVSQFAPKYGLFTSGNVGYLTHSGGWNEAEIAELTCEHLEVYLAGAIAYKQLLEKKGQGAK